mmetsp:Transcript_10390/g.25340  ORF Transcript_10390/g.25340 Transcript_10390/m.25340 type:complete len:272 (-) Transcript_10390:28-843(-)
MPGPPSGPWSPGAPAAPGGPGGPRCKLANPAAPGWPSGPSLPMGPAYPLAPFGPSAPSFPGGPIRPGVPRGPSIPFGPRTHLPTGPISPRGPEEPRGPLGPPSPVSPGCSIMLSSLAESRALLDLILSILVSTSCFRRSAWDTELTMSCRSPEMPCRIASERVLSSCVARIALTGSSCVTSPTRMPFPGAAMTVPPGQSTVHGGLSPGENQPCSTPPGSWAGAKLLIMPCTAKASSVVGWPSSCRRLPASQPPTSSASTTAPSSCRAIPAP